MQQSVAARSQFVVARLEPGGPRQRCGAPAMGYVLLHVLEVQLPGARRRESWARTEFSGVLLKLGRHGTAWVLLFYETLKWMDLLEKVS